MFFNKSFVIKLKITVFKIGLKKKKRMVLVEFLKGRSKLRKAQSLVRLKTFGSVFCCRKCNVSGFFFFAHLK